MPANERVCLIFGMATNVVLPKDWMAIEAIGVIKCLDREGDPRLLVAGTRTLNQWEAVGMLTAALDSVRDDLSEIMVSPDETDPDGS